jgi:glc operon protein GlcG
VEQSPELCRKELLVGFLHASDSLYRHRFRFVLPDDGWLEAVEVGLTTLPLNEAEELTDNRRRFMRARHIVYMVLGLLLLPCLSVGARAQMPNPYGLSISVEDAKKAAALSLAEARKNSWSVAVAVVDPSGNLVYYEKMDNTQLGSANVSIDKARSAALFKRPTKALQDALAAGGDGLRILRLQGATPIEGGIPLVSDGKIVGAIGVSGATSAQDAQCAKAGADAFK